MVHLNINLTLAMDWEVALVQAYIPHRDSHFQDSFSGSALQHESKGYVLGKQDNDCTYRRHHQWDRERHV